MITKPKTNEFKKITTTRISGSQSYKKLAYVLNFSVESGGGVREMLVYCTPAVSDLVERGYGFHHRKLRQGLKQCAEFYYILCLRKRTEDEIEAAKTAGVEGALPVEEQYADMIVCNIHALPNTFYQDINIAKELSRANFYNDEMDAVVIMFNTKNKGSIAVVGYPTKMQGYVNTMLKTLENMETIDESFSLTLSNELELITENAEQNELLLRLRDSSPTNPSYRS